MRLTTGPNLQNQVMNTEERDILIFVCNNQFKWMRLTDGFTAERSHISWILKFWKTYQMLIYIFSSYDKRKEIKSCL